MKYAITKDMTTEQRLAVIRKHAQKFQSKVTRNARIRDYTETPKEEQGIDTHNINAYTDPEKYVDEYYGDRARSVSAYDNEWN